MAELCMSSVKGWVLSMDDGVLWLHPWPQHREHPSTRTAQETQGPCQPEGDTGWGALLSPEGVPDVWVLQKLRNHMENRCGKWALRKNYRSCSRQHQALPKSCLSITLCASSLAPVYPDQLPGFLSLHPGVESGRESRKSHAGSRAQLEKQQQGLCVPVCEERVRQDKPNLA